MRVRVRVRVRVRACARARARARSLSLLGARVTALLGREPALIVSTRVVMRAAAGRIASGAAESEPGEGGAGSGGSNAHDAGLEARLEALQEALASKVAELSRVNSERTALQLRCDKQAKAAREQEL